MTPITDTLTLWGSPHSFYAGKVRSYLIKKSLPFREQTLADPRFKDHVVPTVRHMVVPVVELPDGSLLQDSTGDVRVRAVRRGERTSDTGVGGNLPGAAAAADQ